MRYSKEWQTVVKRLGRWIDMENNYKTMDLNFMESVWWVFHELYEKNMVYRGFKVMPYSTGCTTPLSNFEANMAYKDVSDPAVYVAFPIVGEENVAFVAWTTTPWTLPSNLALCVNPNLEYVHIFGTWVSFYCYLVLNFVQIRVARGSLSCSQKDSGICTRSLRRTWKSRRGSLVRSWRASPTFHSSIILKRFGYSPWVIVLFFLRRKSAGLSKSLWMGSLLQRVVLVLCTARQLLVRTITVYALQLELFKEERSLCALWMPMEDSLLKLQSMLANTSRYGLTVVRAHLLIQCRMPIKTS